jgi:hypothetical protein
MDPGVEKRLATLVRPAGRTVEQGGRESDLQRLAREGAVERGLLRAFRRGRADGAVQLHGAGRLGLRTPAGPLGWYP